MAGMPTEHLAAGSDRLRKTTCTTCKNTIYVVEINGQRVITDSELIAVVPDRGGRERTLIAARRLHAETCDRRRRDYEKAKLRAEQRAWERKQRGKSRTKGP